MKRLFWACAATGLFVWPGLRLARRWSEESADRKIVLLADWYEARDLAARQAIPDDKLLERLQEAGATGILLSPFSLSELSLRHRVLPVQAMWGRDPLDAQQLIAEEPLLAAQIARELALRGVDDVSAGGASRRVLSRRNGAFLSVKEVELGYDPVLMTACRNRGLAAFLRLNRDPWTQPAQLEQYNAPDSQLRGAAGILFNTDEPPGGADALNFWKSWIDTFHPIELLFEFHPARSAVQLGRMAPAGVYRAHTIASAELKDMTPEQEISRWRRAVQERSCRVLLLHASTTDSFPGYLDRVTTLRRNLEASGWRFELPAWRNGWSASSTARKLAASLGAFLLAAAVPCLALALAWRLTDPRNAVSISWPSGFLVMMFVTLAGAALVAAVAQTRELQLELAPFRGVKIVFLLSWLGSTFVLYRAAELWRILREGVRRWDVLVGAFVFALIAYVMIRSGNASSAWKHPLEQGFRDRLETLLVYRPRFKEFAWGHPLLLLGLYLRRAATLSRRRDVRPLMLLGMLGPVSVVNTFCHLHSPLEMALWRSVLGIVFGGLIGLWLIWIYRKADSLLA